MKKQGRNQKASPKGRAAEVLAKKKAWQAQKDADRKQSKHRELQREKSKKQKQGQPAKSKAGKPKGFWLHGRHAVVAALTVAKRPVKEILLTKEPDAELLALLKDASVRLVEKEFLDEQFPDTVHQGIAGSFGPLPPAALADIWESKLVLMLDQVTDPHNLGAILRSADAFGCGGVIVPTARSAALNDVVAKTACGAMETVPVVEMNLSQAIDQLKEQGFWVVGMAGEAEQMLADVPKFEKTCLVMGSEGEGLRELVRKKCDHLAKLPMVGTVESLNVSVATGIALYEIS